MRQYFEEVETTCGAPWERVVVKSRTFESGSGQSGNMPDGKHGPDLQGGGETLDVRRGPCVQTTTIGWRPTCAHYDSRYRLDLPQAKSARKRYQRDVSGNWWKRARKRPGLPHWPVEPCAILDPFAGAGTSGMVALEHSRDAILIELNEEYCDMMRKRLQTQQIGIPLW